MRLAALLAPPGPGLWSVPLVLVLGACPNDLPPGPLDPGPLTELAKGEGDAEGSALSGRYLVVGEPVACDCPAQPELDLCAPELVAFTGATGRIDLTQIGGFLTWMSVEDLSAFGMSGAINRDGTFVLAAIYGLGNLLAAGDIYARLDGVFVDERSFTGTLDYRLRGQLGAGPFDCRISIILTGARAPAT